eukprot:7385315-Prymnesium_polylepis.4
MFWRRERSVRAAKGKIRRKVSNKLAETEGRKQNARSRERGSPSKSPRTARPRTDAKRMAPLPLRESRSLYWHPEDEHGHQTDERGQPAKEESVLELPQAGRRVQLKYVSIKPLQALHPGVVFWRHPDCVQLRHQIDHLDEGEKNLELCRWAGRQAHADEPTCAAACRNGGRLRSSQPVDQVAEQHKGRKNNHRNEDGQDQFTHGRALLALSTVRHVVVARQDANPTERTSELRLAVRVKPPTAPAHLDGRSGFVAVGTRTPVARVQHKRRKRRVGRAVRAVRAPFALAHRTVSRRLEESLRAERTVRGAGSRGAAIRAILAHTAAYLPRTSRAATLSAVQCVSVGRADGMAME